MDTWSPNYQINQNYTINICTLIQNCSAHQNTQDFFFLNSICSAYSPGLQMAFLKGRLNFS